MRSYAADVSLLLESGLPVVIYSGLEDLICNSLSQHWCGATPPTCYGCHGWLHSRTDSWVMFLCHSTPKKS
jgi:hypothetical protein